ncbi:40 kDa putative membrane-spanning ATPase [Reticulomyxa filosa]|uniref:40 kDa putative membrane-spanning ATPase n=1 Tax=Reticulomyxa filosa TaxID=46433 RepID=X6MSR5_RETFI|nr:40 kDa putative membrane-spanning ATPase [Reticulomyxa filosa]|eukprot:ETO16155.1 40 kDa putative membrane-spanning ATPase [Reticulomyxa filosa]
MYGKNLNVVEAGIRSMIPENASISSQPLTFEQSRDGAQQTASLVITHSKDWWTFFSEVVLLGGSLAALGYMFSQLVKQAPDADGNLGRKKIAEHVKTAIIKRIEASGRKIRKFSTSTYEDALLDMIVLPNQIAVQFNDIGGLDSVKSDLMETVLVPLMHPGLTSTSRLCAPPLGVLFYGAPGTGKSMMAKAVARETNATFFS